MAEEITPAEIGRADRALHGRMTIACEAARSAGLPGSFRTWEQDGLRAVLVTDPALMFLSTMSGVAPDTVVAAIHLLHDPRWAGISPRLSVQSQWCAAVGPSLRAAGLEQSGERVLAVKRLAAEPVAAGRPGGGAYALQIADAIDIADASAPGDGGVGLEADAQHAFSAVLLAGYQVDGMVAAFISAEHRHPQVSRFLAQERWTPSSHDLRVFRVRERGAPIAAAAMTVHDDVAVLGGAGTVPEHRGRGAQSALLRHRLRKAVGAGCDLAVATAAPGSQSERNLRSVGFEIHRHGLWQQS